MRTPRDLLATLLFVATACFSGSAISKLDIPVVHHALADTAAGTLTLDGQSFGSTPGKAWLAKTQLAIHSWDDQQIVAALPPDTAPGDHLVTIQTARLFPAFFTVTLGGASGGSAGGSITGVVSACGAPVERTLVYIPGRSFVVFTAANGAFQLDNVPPGSYDVKIEPAGHPATVLQAVAVTAGATADTGTTVIVDLNTTEHCGACGNTCAASPGSSVACVNGQCQATSCSAGFGNCDGNAANGCETALDTRTNCGTCGVACALGTSCLAGLCVQQCGDNSQCALQQYCETQLGVCAPDLANGQACTASAQCQSSNCELGSCQEPCPAGTRRCESAGFCISTTSQCP